MNKRIVVVIPIYKETPNFFEKVSLQQVSKVLGDYDKILIMPDNVLDNNYSFIKGHTVIRFDNKFFASRSSYSRLLLSPGFYNRFIDYEYMLVYQPDAFIIQDDLEKFIKKKFDYIGAPCGWQDSPLGLYQVYNGGFSLRRIESCINVLQEQLMSIMEGDAFENKCLDYEDNFFSYCGYNKHISFSVAPLHIAASFSVQNDAGHGLRNAINGIYPCGIHHWPDLNYKIWRPVVQKFGYDLPDISDVESEDVLTENRMKREYLFLSHVIRHCHNRDKLNKLGRNLPFYSKRIFIWGAGKYGRGCKKILSHLGINDFVFVDKMHADAIAPDEMMEQYEQNKSRSFIIIGTIKYNDEITGILEKWGYSRWKDFIGFSELLETCMFPKLEEMFCIPGITMNFEGQP